MNWVDFGKKTVDERGVRIFISPGAHTVAQSHKQIFSNILRNSF